MTKRHAIPQTLRFWIYWQESIVRLSIREGQTIDLHSGGPTDEGYSYAHERYTFEDGILTRQYNTSACDCDGRIDQFQDDTWTPDDGTVHCIAHRSDGSFYDLPELRPDWQRGSRSQRDHFAEAAGY